MDFSLQVASLELCCRAIKNSGRFEAEKWCDQTYSWKRSPWPTSMWGVAWIRGSRGWETDKEIAAGTQRGKGWIAFKYNSNGAGEKWRKITRNWWKIGCWEAGWRRKKEALQASSLGISGLTRPLNVMKKKQKTDWREGREMMRPILDMLKLRCLWNISVEIFL